MEVTDSYAHARSEKKSSILGTKLIRRVVY
jgi:hypothetical protein